MTVLPFSDPLATQASLPVFRDGSALAVDVSSTSIAMKSPLAWVSVTAGKQSAGQGNFSETKSVGARNVFSTLPLVMLYTRSVDDRVAASR